MRRRLSTIVAALLLACVSFDAGAQFSWLFGRTPQPLKVALVLPFRIYSDKPSSNFMDFYCGALMAVEEQRDRKRDIVLEVIDYSQYGTKPAELETLLADCDLVVGPVDPADVAKVAEICHRREIPFVSPLDRNTAHLARSNPYFFQVPVSNEHQISNLISNLDGGNCRVTLIEDSNPDDFAKSVKAALNEEGIRFRRVSYQISRGRIIVDSLRRALSPNMRNQVIIASETEAFASDVARNLNLIARSENLDLEVYASGRIRNFDTIDPEVLYNINTHFSTSYYIDYYDEQTHSFILKYRALYNGEPSPFSFSGYDIFTFFISALCDLKGTFFDYIDFYTLHLRQGNFRFRRYGYSGGFENTRTRDVEYTRDGKVSVY